MGPFPRIAVEEDVHHPVGGSVAVGFFLSAQKIGHQLVEFHAFLVIGRGQLVQGACLFQILLISSGIVSAMMAGPFIL